MINELECDAELCPFGDISLDIDLSGMKLLPSEKHWIGEQLRKGKGSLSDFNKKYNLNIKTLSKYRCRCSKGFTSHAKEGRPRILDGESRNILKNGLAIMLILTMPI